MIEFGSACRVSEKRIYNSSKFRKWWVIQWKQNKKQNILSKIWHIHLGCSYPYSCFYHMISQLWTYIYIYGHSPDSHVWLPEGKSQLWLIWDPKYISIITPFIILAGGFKLSEKYESQLGLLFLMESHKIHVPNHQPAIYYWCLLSSQPCLILRFLRFSLWSELPLTRQSFSTFLHCLQVAATNSLPFSRFIRLHPDARQSEPSKMGIDMDSTTTNAGISWG